MSDTNKVYQLITDRIVKLLEDGTAPWRKPWGGELLWPKNLVSGKGYRGINVFLLSHTGFDSPYWLTYNQAKKLGGNVKKGEKGSPIVFWKMWERKNADGEVSRIPCLRYYTGFNVAQCEGLPADKVPATPTYQGCDFDPIKQCESVVEGYKDGPEITNEYSRAFYRPGSDLVGMPKPVNFDSSEEYYSTLFHELTHSTGHKSRLGRSGIADVVEFGSDSYGKEELIAEMGAAFLCGKCSIENRTLENSANYLNSWLKIIKQDVKMVVQAAAAAQKAVDRILGVTFDN